MRRPLVCLLVAVAAWAGVQFRTHAQAPVGLDATLFREMKWRNIGPFVGGRTSAVAGVPSQPNTFYIGVDNGGVWKTTDAGRTWMAVLDDQPIGAVATLTVAATDPAVVEVGGRDGTYRSTDAGKTWKQTGPGVAATTHPERRDRPEWTNPQHPEIRIVGGDHGASITVNGGASWSSVVNQPTTSFERVGVDSTFPYRVCGAQIDAPAICVQSRSDSGQISARETTPVGGAAAGYVAIDGNDPDILYSGRVTRFDRRSGQVQDVGPTRGGDFRVSTTPPVLFAPTDPRTLLFGTSSVWKSATGGQTWTAISPALSPGAIVTLAPSYVDGRVIWAGTDDGQIHVTRDNGANWTNVTPAAAGPSAVIASIEASHFDGNMAYAAVRTNRADDVRPHLLRTRDGGASWTEIVTGLPAGADVNAVREDPFRRGLLFAGTAHTVFMSFDDGERWLPLRLNLPVTEVRDLAIKDSDLVIATQGRGLWILDDITPLRQITPDIARADAYLFRPATAWRFRADKNPGARLAADEPTAANPADGVIINYLLGASFTGTVELEILDTQSGDVFRRYSNTDAVRPLPATPGLHRVVWDVRYAPPDATPVRPGMWILPGTYQVRLSANGRAMRQAVVVRLDPRVKTPIADLTQQYRLTRAMDEMLKQVAAVRRAPEYAGRPAAHRVALDAAAMSLLAAFDRLQDSDARPTAATEAAVNAAITAATAALALIR
ncbi:MAG TPA: hypothetical protein VFV98_18885 [Vicinamibacterales bacterium]|nr:hypothetical protein [Vicinamibacterales bacterium]